MYSATLCNWQLTGGGNNSLALTSSQSRGAGSRALAQSCCSNFVRSKPFFTFTLFFAKAPFWALTYCSPFSVTRIW